MPIASPSTVTNRLYYGWWIVVVCLVAGLVGNALGLFGAGVYLHAITETRGWPVGFVSGGVTLFYVVSALLLIPVGSTISRLGPRPVLALGAVAMAIGVAGIGRVNELWQAYVAFLTMGLGWACLSTTAIATTLAPWFERYQGRAVSIASLGASAGGMIGVPVLTLRNCAHRIGGRNDRRRVDRRRSPHTARPFRAATPASGYGPMSRRCRPTQRSCCSRRTDVDPGQGVAYRCTSQCRGDLRHRYDGANRFPDPTGDNDFAFTWCVRHIRHGLGHGDRGASRPVGARPLRRPDQ